MKIFIAGATGVLGRRVTRGLISSGHQVVGLSRSDLNNQVIKQMGGEPKTGNLFNREEMLTVTSDCEAILHLATSIPTKLRTTLKDWELNDRIRIEGTKNLINAAVKNNCKLYVQQSITAVYGDQEGKSVVNEQTEIPLNLPKMVKSAVKMEELVKDIDNENLKTIILRFGSFYSYDSAHTSTMFEMVNKGKFPIIGKGNVFKDFINVDDAANAVIKAVEFSNKINSKVFNICDDEPVLYKDLITFLADKLNAKRPGNLPEFLAKVFVGTDITKFLLSSRRTSNDKARKELGWLPEFPGYREGHSYEIGKWLSSHNHRQLVLDKY